MTVSIGDFNRDGWPDIIFGMAEKYEKNQFHHFAPLFFKNVSGSYFVNVSDELFLQNTKAYTRGISWVDFDNDSSLEIYASNYRLNRNFLWKKSNGKYNEIAERLSIQGEFNPAKFVDDITNQTYGPQYGHSLGSTWADYDNDGFFDLWVSKLAHKFVG